MSSRFITQRLLAILINAFSNEPSPEQESTLSVSKCSQGVLATLGCVQKFALKIKR